MKMELFSEKHILKTKMFTLIHSAMESDKDLTFTEIRELMEIAIDDVMYSWELKKHRLEKEKKK
jgi:hypothetical protein